MVSATATLGAFTMVQFCFVGGLEMPPPPGVDPGAEAEVDPEFEPEGAAAGGAPDAALSR
ncbi:MAG: hypothetical protein EKK40_03500 [Bradyrhizobiaceae bacterium]|nr:MAG: hypothetical protein EKK40_03500 [Bradyrhizobiaceae bacterium]